MIQQMLSNWVCWAIVIVALFCYQRLWLQWFMLRDPKKQEDNERPYTTMLIGVMPLLGLLGTIIGLLDCFANMAIKGAGVGLISGGIADAMLTTQFGLVCAIPGWLLQGFVQGRAQRGVTPIVRGT